MVGEDLYVIYAAIHQKVNIVRVIKRYQPSKDSVKMDSVCYKWH